MNLLIGLLWIFGPWVVLIASAWWVYNDLTKFRQLGVTRLSPGIWSFLVFVLWLPFFPIYFSLRWLVFKNKSKIIFAVSVFLILLLTEFAVYFLAKQLYFERKASVLTRQEANEKIIELVEKSFEKNDNSYRDQIADKQLSVAQTKLNGGNNNLLDQPYKVSNCASFGVDYVKFVSPSTTLSFCFPSAWGKQQLRTIVHYGYGDGSELKPDEPFVRINFIHVSTRSPGIEYYKKTELFKCFDTTLSDEVIVKKCRPRSIIKRFKIGEATGFKIVSVGSVAEVSYVIVNENNSGYIFIDGIEVQDLVGMDKMVASIRY